MRFDWHQLTTNAAHQHPHGRQALSRNVFSRLNECSVSKLEDKQFLLNSISGAFGTTARASHSVNFRFADDNSLICWLDERAIRQESVQYFYYSLCSRIRGISALTWSLLSALIAAIPWQQNNKYHGNDEKMMIMIESRVSCGAETNTWDYFFSYSVFRFIFAEWVIFSFSKQ